MSAPQLSRALAFGAAIWILALSFIARSSAGTLLAGMALLCVVWGVMNDGEG